MKSYTKREDDFQKRRQHLEGLSDKALEQRFWSLLESTVDPLLELARTHTSPSIERSILLRMGFSSIEAKPLVEMAINKGFIAKGVGHCVYKVAKKTGLPIREAGLEMLEDRHWDNLVFKVEG